MRIALVLYGQPRFVGKPYAARSHFRALKGHDVHVFGHFWHSDSHRTQAGSFWSGLKTLQMPPNAPDLLAQSYPNANFIFEAPKAFQMHEDLFQALKQESLLSDRSQVYLQRLNNFSNVASHLYSLHRAIAHFDVARQEKDFDLVVLSRFDNFLIRLPKLENLPPDKLVLAAKMWPFVDMIALGPASKISALDAFGIVQSEDLAIDTLLPEQLKAKSFLTKFIESDVYYAPIELVLLRSNSILVSFAKWIKPYFVWRILPAALRLYSVLGLPRLSEVRQEQTH